MAYILHIDTSGDKGIVAVTQDGELVAERINTDTRNHAAVINIYIEELLKTQQIGLKDLSAIAVCGGPGSYTGLRIGLATAKALCYTLDIPLLHHDRLLLLTLSQINNGLLVYEQFAGILPAREKEYFFGIYDKELNNMFGPRHIFANEIPSIMDKMDKSITITGKLNDESDRNLFEPTTFVETDILNMKLWAKYAYDLYMGKKIADLALAEPFYLKQVHTHK